MEKKGNRLISAKVPPDAYERREKLALKMGSTPKWGFLVMRGIRAEEDQDQLNLRMSEMEKKVASAIAIAQKYAQMYHALIDQEKEQLINAKKGGVLNKSG